MNFVDLGKVKLDDSLFVSGYFQDRSLAANTYTALTPFSNKGDGLLIQGNKFVAPKTGTYAIHVGGGTFSASSTPTAALIKNVEIITGTVYEGTVGVMNLAGLSMSTVPIISALVYLEASEYLTYHLRSLAAQSTFSNGVTTHKFLFSQIR